MTPEKAFQKLYDCIGLLNNLVKSES